MIKRYLGLEWADRQVVEAIKFLEESHPEFKELSWERKMAHAINFVSLRKQNLQEKRYAMQLLAGPIPAIIAMMGWLITLIWK